MPETPMKLLLYRLHCAYRLRTFYAKDLTMKEAKPGFESKFKTAFTECMILEELFSCYELCPMTLNQLRYLEDIIRREYILKAS